jgi:hypothetical protein
MAVDSSGRSRPAGRRGAWVAGLALALGLAHPAVAQQESPALPAATYSVTRGHFTEPFSLVITAPADGMSVWVTTDGSVPAEGVQPAGIEMGTDANGAATATVRVDRTMSVRSVVTDARGGLSRVATQSFVFPSLVLHQGSPDLQFVEWGHSGPDWEMDPDVVGHEDPASRAVPADLMSVPTLYLSLPFEDFWGPDGIYIEGEGDERAVSVELLNPSGDPDDPNGVAGLQVDGTVEITGGSSTERWKTDKLSMRLRFQGGIEFPVFEHASVEAGRASVQDFHTLILDARLNESWNHPDDAQQEVAQYTRDQFIADVQNATGGFAPHGRHVHLYVAGIYWGLYSLHERPDHHFAESYRGGKSSDFNVVKHHFSDVVHGDSTTYLRLRDLVDSRDIDSPQGYAEVTAILDVEDFARYMLLNYWAGNTDWSYQNWYASSDGGAEDARLRFHAWDSEHTLKGVSEDVTDKDDRDGPTHFHRRLMENPAYRALFADVVAKARTGGILDSSFTSSLYSQRLAEVDLAVRAEAARWGDNRRRRPYVRGDEWMEERDRLLEEWFPRRTEEVLRQFERAGWLP